MDISIGIPVYNEQENIEKLLKFLSKQKYCTEIFVVGGGKDDTVNVIKKFREKIKNLIFIEEKVRKGKSSAVNLILKMAKGDAIVFIDSDTLPANTAIQLLVKKISGDVGVVGGRPIVEVKCWKDDLSAIIWDMHDILLKLFPEKFSGSFYALKSGIIKKIPHDIINDDGFIASKVLNKGYSIAYEPNAVAYVKNKNDLISHLRRRRRINVGYWQLKKLDIGLIPFPIILEVLISYIKTNKRNIFNILIIIGLEVIANLLAFVDRLTKTTPYIWKR